MYAGIFENGDSFSLPYIACTNRFGPSIKTDKTMDYSIPYWACTVICMTSSYSKTSLFVRPHEGFALFPHSLSINVSQCFRPDTPQKASIEQYVLRILTFLPVSFSKKFSYFVFG